jgi:hypothetical protein
MRAHMVLGQCGSYFKPYHVNSAQLIGRQADSILSHYFIEEADYWTICSKEKISCGSSEVTMFYC